MASWTKEVCSYSPMNIRDKSSNSKLAPVGMAAALFSPKGKPAITLAVPSVRLSAPALPSHRCPRAPHPWTGCAQGYCYVVRSLKKKIFQSFPSPAQVSEARAQSLTTPGNKMERGVWEGRKEKACAMCVVLFHLGRHSPREKAVSALSISGNALLSPQTRSRAFGDPTPERSACHQYYNRSRSMWDPLCVGKQGAGSPALVSKANRSMGVSPA